jgi:hypothetical protein
MIMGFGQRPHACWDCGFEARWGHGCLSLVSAVCCQVDVSATGQSVIQRSPTGFECDLARVGLLRRKKKNSLLPNTVCSLCDPFGLSYLRNRKMYLPTTNPQGRYISGPCHYSQCHRIIRTYDRGAQIFQKSRSHGSHFNTQGARRLSWSSSILRTQKYYMPPCKIYSPG